MNPLMYKPRRCEFSGFFFYNDYSIKVYEIFSESNTKYISEKDLLFKLVKKSYEHLGVHENDHTLGFCIFHYADDGWYLLSQIWNNANNIRSQVYTVEHNLKSITPLNSGNIIACLWEIRLFAHESFFWQNAILNQSTAEISTEHRDNYMKNYFNGEL